MDAPDPRPESQSSTEASAWSLVRPWFRVIGVAAFIVACKYGLRLAMPDLDSHGAWLLLAPLLILFVPSDARA
jgi:hypothetical protein